MEEGLVLFGFLLLVCISIIDFKKQEFSELQALLFMIGFFIIGLIQGYNFINFLIMFFVIALLINKSILYEGDLLIAGFAYTYLASPIWLILSLGLGYCLTIFYKEITKKTSTGFIPYFTISILLLNFFTLI